MRKNPLKKRIEHFFTYKLWSIPIANQIRSQRILLKLLRILALAFRGFKEDKISLRASALTVFSLMAIVPVVAMAFGIAKGFGLKKYIDELRLYLEENLLANVESQQEIIDQIFEFANSFLDNTKGGLIAGIGLVILLWSVLKVFGNIESSFNAVWQIRRSRTWLRKFSDYFSLMLIGPILIVISSSATIFVITRMEEIAANMEVISFMEPIILFLIRLIPYALIWLLFTFLYMFMPNTKVKFRSALIGGIVAGSIFALTQWLYINFQIGVSRYNAIYGSFAALPLFIIWLQVSWLIVLLGAEIAFAEQNLDQYEFETDIENMSNYSKKILALIITHLMVHNFKDAEKPLTAEQISQKLKIPMRLVRKILYELVECRILSEIISPDTKERAYQPGQDVDNLSIAYVLNKLDHLGKDRILSINGKEQEKIKEIVDGFSETVNQTEATKLLKEIN
ncbi:MAG: YihY/virulence factor BrkB family protein [Bacteroidota bacterium]